MKVNLCKIENELPIKNNGVTFTVAATDGGGGDKLGELNVTKSGLKWKPANKQKSREVAWEDFIEFMNDSK